MTPDEVELLDNPPEETSPDLRKLKEDYHDRYYRIMQTGHDTERNLVISPYWGNYGLAGYVITIQGSPTHGLAVLDLERNHLTCISAYKTARILYGRADLSKNKKALYETTISILKALNLRLDVGGKDNPAVYYVRAGVQEER